MDSKFETQVALLPKNNVFLSGVENGLRLSQFDLSRIASFTVISVLPWATFNPQNYKNSLQTSKANTFFLLTHRSVVEDLYWLPALVTSLLEFGDPKVCGL